MKRRILFLFLVAALAIVQLPPPVLAATPEISTNASYHWGEVITINGSKFDAWTSVAISLWRNEVFIQPLGQVDNCDQNGAFTFTTTVAAEWTPGTYRIVANSLTGSASVTFELIATVDHIIITPLTAAIVAGGSQTYTATAYDGLGNSWGVTSQTSFSISPDGSVVGSNVSASIAGPHLVTGLYIGKSATASLQVNPATLDHFAFATISSPKIATLSFTVTITALDPHGNQQTGFSGTVDLSASNGGVTPSTSGSFTAGVWIGTLAVNEEGAGVTLRAQNGSAFGSSNAILVKPAMFTVTLPLTPGWNLISVPVITGLSPDELFAALPAGWQFYAWDAAAQAYIMKKDIPQVLVGSGYWLKLPGTSPLPFPVTGIAASTVIRVNLIPGWNMIGTSWPTPMAWSALRVEKDGLSKTLGEAVAAGWVKNKLWQYVGGVYANVGYGYWLQVNLSCTLVLPPP
ncbi:MAG: hypothetical protein NTV14_04450 [Coprothermobacterota bacterium]|nr:hypothetical protein [Coprothermobacterota bacterium]